MCSEPEEAGTRTDSHGERNSGLAAAEDFARIARVLLAGQDVETTLGRICALAVEHIDGCDHAGVSLVDRREITTRGATDDVAPRVDAIQYATGEGPCLDAIRDHDILEVADLASDARWPQFAPVAVRATGIHSILSYRLFVERNTLGALNLYSAHENAFRAPPAAAEWGSVFAAHAAVALKSALDVAGMNQALDSRATIGVAMGMLMARENMTQQQAFDVLRRASQRMNVKLKTIAARLAGGEVTVADVSQADRAVEE